MCGIAGYVGIEQTREEAMQLMERMCAAIRHRGPDEQGIWADTCVALGMRRLAIIDVSSGQQPMFNEDGSIVIVFNGEIYNYRELQQTLQLRGHRFQTQSDTEVIVHAYEEYGDRCVTHLRGMFTFAIWDSKRQRLFIARDRFGKKPLNYYWDGQRFIFGSEIKSILQAGIARQINHAALDDYLMHGYIHAPLTLFEGVMKLPAAHTLTLEAGRLSIQRYWDLPFAPTCHDDEQTAIARLSALLKDAVAVRLMSEVPLGAFLSGGIDSSLVVALMSQVMAQPVKTFSIGFEEQDFNELPYARQVAQHFHTDHHEFLVRPDLVAVLPQLVWAYDEPFSDPSMLPTYYVSKLAREHVTVVLTGDGGDEIFCGYTRYQRERMMRYIPPLLRSVLSYGSRLMPEGMRGKKRLGSLRQDLATRYGSSQLLLPIQARTMLYSQELFAQMRRYDPLEHLREQFCRVEQRDAMTQMQYADIQTYLPDDILVKVDKASMFNSLETRAPLLDQHLAEYVASLPAALRVRDGTLKYLLKKVAANLLPPEILARPKQGFGVPLKHWFRDDLSAYAHDILTSSKAQQRGIFQAPFVQHLLQSHAQSKLVNQSQAIWALLCLEVWFQVYMDTPALGEQSTFERSAYDLA